MAHSNQAYKDYLQSTLLLITRILRRDPRAAYPDQWLPHLCHLDLHRLAHKESLIQTCRHYVVLGRIHQTESRETNKYLSAHSLV